MNLINTARALDDQRFLWRVRAAIIMIAAEKSSATDESDKECAKTLLASPMTANPIIESIVAASIEVANAVTVDANNTVDTESVNDSDIVNVVRQSWPLMKSSSLTLPLQTSL